MPKKFAFTFCCLALSALATTRPATAQMADEIKQQYDTAFAAATKTRDDTLARIDETHKAALAAAKEEVRKTFEPLFKNAKPEAAETYTQKMNAILAVDTAVGMARITGGRDTALLVGQWQPKEWLDSYSDYIFDFTSDKSMVFTKSYRYSSSSSGYQSEQQQVEYTVKILDGKVTILPVTPTNIYWFPGIKYNSSRDTMRHRFEIVIPFDPDNPVMTFSCIGNTIPLTLKRVK